MSEDTPSYYKVGSPEEEETELVEHFRAELESFEDISSLQNSDEETERRMHDEAQREVYADTPAKELLYDTWKVLKHSKFFHNSYDQRRVLEAAKVELVEAYSVIEPSEAFSLLGSMGSLPYEGADINIDLEKSKVEALAKFGYITGDQESIDEARKLAKKKPDAPAPRSDRLEYPENADRSERNLVYRRAYYRHKNKIKQSVEDKFLLLAVYAKDTKSMHQLFKKRDWELDRKDLRDHSFSERAYQGVEEGLENISGPVSDLSSLGYLPAIERDKRRAVYIGRFVNGYFKDETKTQTLGAKLEKLVGGILTIESQIQNGKLAPHFHEDDEMLVPEEASKLHFEFWKIIKDRQAGILRELQHPEELLPDVVAPAFESALGSKKNEQVTEDLLERAKLAVEENGIEALKSALVLEKTESNEPVDKSKNAWVLALVRALKNQALEQEKLVLNM